MTLLALIGALALASIPLTLGWRRTAGEAEMSRALGLSLPKRGFDLEKFARQTGTGLKFRQLLFGGLAWVAGGLTAGLILGILPAVLFAVAGGLLYAGSLSNRRQEVRLRQARDILRGLSVMETLLSQGRPLSDALDEAAQAVGSDGQLVLSDLVIRMRAAPADRAASAVREWTLAWDNPAVDIVGTALLAALEGRIEIAPLIAALRKTLSDIIEVLSRARAAARGVEWQARFLALFPPGVLVTIALTTPEMGDLYAANPLLVIPVLFGSGLSYLLSMRMLQNGLSIEASLGLQAGQYAEIRVDRMGRVL
jgi:Flp pilus assembly protein TadB